MGNNFRTIYLYLVSFITLMMIIGGIVSTVNNLISYAYPDSYAFFNSGYNNKITRENYKKEKIKNAVVSSVVIVIGGIMYKYHWDIIENERKK